MKRNKHFGLHQYILLCIGLFIWQNAFANGLCCDDNSTLQGIHPYLQQTKGMSCSQSKAKSGAMVANGGNFERHYLSFFDNEPVYYLTSRPILDKWWEGVDISPFELEGDTIVDNIRYHILRTCETYTYPRKNIPFWVRENDRHDKVWVRLPWDTTGNETLVVDLNLEVGDLFPMCTSPDTIYYRVDSVYYATNDLKHIRLSPTTNNSWTEALERVNPLGYFIINDTPSGIPTYERMPYNCEWTPRHLEFIEGVGSNLGFVYRRLGLTDSVWEPLRGYYDAVAAPSEYFDNESGQWEFKPPMLYDYVVCVGHKNKIFYEHPVECTKCSSNLILFDDVIYDEGFNPPPHISNENSPNLSRYLRVSPNPARSQTTLQWDAQAPIQGACRISLYTLQGLEIRTFTANQWPYTLNVSNLPDGTYMLRVTPTDASSAEQVVVRLIVL